MSDVFISYSRADKEFVTKLHEAFSQKKQEIWVDWESIPPSKLWWDEIKYGIAKTNNFVVIMSPNSMSSPICHMEIEEARRLGKRIIPVLRADYTRKDCLQNISDRLFNPTTKDDPTRELWGNRQADTLFDDNQKSLSPINYLFFKPEDNFVERFEKLLETILEDFDHKEKHTMLGLRTQTWNQNKRGVSYLLNGAELKTAEIWLNNALKKQQNPQPTDLQKQYIDVSCKRRRNVKFLIWGTSTLLIFMVMLSIGAFGLRQYALNDLSIVNNQVLSAQATVTQAAIEENIISQFANINLQSSNSFSLQISRMNTLVNEYPNQPRAYVARGAMYTESKQYDRAIENYDEALHINPNHVNAYIWRGLTYNQMREYEKAVADYEKAILLRPNDDIVYINLADTYANLLDNELALENYKKAIAINPQNTIAYHNRANIYRRLKEYELALNDYNQAIAINPQFFEAYVSRGNLYYAMDEKELAKQDWNYASQLNSSYIPGMLIDLPATGGGGEEIVFYENLISINPEMSILYSCLGNVYNNFGSYSGNFKNYEMAIKNYNQAIRLNPNDIIAYNNRGNTYFKIAEDMLQYGKVRIPFRNNITPYIQIQNYQMLAFADYNKAIQINPNHIVAYLNRGNAYLNLGDNELAFKDYDYAIALSPNDALSYLVRSNAYQSFFNTEKAFDDYGRAMISNRTIHHCVNFVEIVFRG